MKNLLALFLLVLCFISCSTASKKNEALSTPDHLVLMVFDAMRPDYIDRFNLKNFKKLRALSQNYEEAFVGYVGSETVVSHAVMSNGRKPRDMPWGDDVMLDGQGILGEPGHFYSTGGLSFEQLSKLMKQMPGQTFLAARLKEKLKGKVYAVGQKHYASMVMGTPEADSVITLKKDNGICSVDGINVPAYILKNNRFDLNCALKYGTEKTFYPYDGNRFVPGNDSKHIGGDAWVTDVAFEVMNQKDWSGMLLTFGAIDKVAHMLGEQDGPRAKETNDIKTPYTLKTLLEIADTQVGRMMDRLEKEGLMGRTMIVLTADHGGQTDVHYLGNGKTGKWGAIKNESSEEAPEWVRSFTKFKGVRFSFQDSGIRTWLAPDADFKHVIGALKKVPGMMEIYQLKNKDQQWNYEQIFSDLKKQPAAVQAWAKKNNQGIVDAAANENAPTLMSLLADGYGFDLVGDHGGAQEHVQRVPLLMYIPGHAGKVLKDDIHLYDVKSKIEAAMQL